MALVCCGVVGILSLDLYFANWLEDVSRKMESTKVDIVYKTYRKLRDRALPMMQRGWDCALYNRRGEEVIFEFELRISKIPSTRFGVINSLQKNRGKRGVWNSWQQIKRIWKPRKEKGLTPKPKID